MRLRFYRGTASNFGAIILPLSLAAGCRLAEVRKGTPANAIHIETQPRANLTGGCVANFDPSFDYFPDKVTVTDAAQFRVTYHGHYKVLQFEPSVHTQEAFRWILLQCGAPEPRLNATTRVVRVPVRSFVLHEPAFGSTVAALGILDRLVGISAIRSYSAPGILEAHSQGKIEEVGSSSHSSIETAIAVDPEVLFTFYSAYPQFNVHPKLWELGVEAVPLASHTELTPLGRTEWIKFVAVFFNREREAGALYAQAAERYLALSERARAVSSRPGVMMGFPDRRDGWSLNGGRNFMARLIEDAGGEYFWKDSIAGSLVYANFEHVFDEASATGHWLASWGAHLVPDLATLVGRDTRLTHFRPVEMTQVHVSDRGPRNTRLIPYQDQSLDKPDIVLADLIKILHPELLPDHEPVFFRKLN